MNSKVMYTRLSGAWLVGGLASLIMSVSASAQYSLLQSDGITINDNSTATPYPSSIVVSNQVQGAIEKVTLTLNQLTHGYPSDVQALLVGPDGQKVVLMSDAGLGGGAINNVTLTFDAGASGSLPATAQIVSGTFKPTNYKGVDNPFFVPPAPVGPYNGSLNDFVGTDPKGSHPDKGTWSLYVVDDALVSAGSLGSWSLNLWTKPTLAVTNLVGMLEDSTATVGVTVTSQSTPANSLKLTAISSNTNIVGNADAGGLVTGGAGQARTLTITPKANQYTISAPPNIPGGGPITITVNVDDGLATVSSTLSLQITNVNNRPTLTLSTNTVSTVVGQLVNSAVIVDADGNPVGTLPLTASIADVDTPVAQLLMAVYSYDTNIVANEGVFFSGTGATRSIAIAPKGAATGNVQVDIFVADPQGLWSKLPLNVTVNPAPDNHPVIANVQPVVVNDNATASPYPSTIAVANVPGLIGRMTVVLADVTHNRPSDMSVLLVGPTGQKVVLMRNAGVGGTSQNARLTFDDSAASIPGTGQITTGSYAPADYGSGSLTSPAPAAPYSSGLSSFIGTNPNGTWSLYVLDSVTGEAGLIRGGWLLNIFPAPTISAIGDQTVNENGTLKVNFTVASVLGTVTNVTATAANKTLVPDANIGVSGTGANRTLTITPASNTSGVTTITVVAQNDSTPNYFATSTFQLTVNFVDQPPTISTIPKQVTRAGVPVLPAVVFTVGDVDDDPATLTVAAISSNQKIVPNSGIILGGSGATRTIALFPVTTQAGSADITVSVSDTKSTTSTTFTLTVLDPAVPLFANANAITVPDNAAASPYPSKINLAGMLGKVTEVKVILVGVTHPNPSDLGILLVGPKGDKVELMRNVGGANAVSGATLILADSATDPLPAGSQLVSGPYRPATYSPAVVYPSPAPTGPYNTVLSTFKTTDPNGDWSLFVVDSVGGNRGGAINGGWELSVRTAPALADIPDQTIKEDQVARISLLIGDEQPGVTMTIVPTSSNPAIVRNADMTVSGSGANRTLNITPVQYANGTVTISVTVTDPDGNPSTKTFKLVITPVDYAPTISDIANQTTPAATATGPITFTVFDPETSDASKIPVTATSSRQDLVPDSNISITVSGGTRTMVIQPAGIGSGVTTITVVASDFDSPASNPQQSKKSFTLTVTPNLAFANAKPITIRDFSTADPYPEVVNVSGVGGLISHMSAVLVGFTHPFASDVSVLLVSPDNSKNVMLMGKAGAGASVTGLRLAFDDNASTTLPHDGPLSSGTFKPTDFGPAYAQPGSPAVTLPPPAPGRPYATSLSTAFNGMSPNGDWKVYVLDDTYPDGGSIDGGCILIFQVSPTISAIGPQTTKENSPLTVSFNAGDSDTDPTNLFFTASAPLATQQAFYAPNLSSSSLLVDVSKSVFAPTNGQPGTLRTFTIVPTQNLFGTNMINVTVTDGTTPNTVSFPLTVTWVNQPPTVSTATNALYIHENQTVVIDYTIGDPDSTVGASNVVVTSSNQALVNDTNIVVTPMLAGANPSQTTTVHATVTPTPFASGITVLTFSVTDRNSTTSQTLTLNVSAVNQPPTITGLSDTNVVAGGTLQLPFKVADVETPAKDLTVTAKSSNQSVVPDSNITKGGSESDRFITLSPIGTGAGSPTTTITVSVSDGVNTTSATFVLTVTPAPGATFANTGTITIRDNNTAQPYPSQINVTGMVGAVSRVRVTLEGLSHTAPDDVGVVLVAPDGETIVQLLSHVGARTQPVSNVRLAFDDSGPLIPPAGPIVTGTFHPSSYGTAYPFPGLPAGPYPDTLATFNGIAANGVWSLYVVDGFAGDSGAIASGWTLTVETAPTIAITSTVPALTGTPPTLTFPESGVSALSPATVNFTIGDMVTPLDKLAINVSSSNQGLMPSGSVSIIRSGANPSIVANLQPAVYQNGTNNLTLTVQRSDGASSSVVIPMFVTAKNWPSAISRLTAKVTQEDVPLTVEFIISNPHQPSTNLMVQALSSNEAVISSTSLLMFNSTNKVVTLPAFTVRMTMVPNTHAVGSATITIAVTDKTDASIPVVSEQFTLTVQQVNNPPTITSIPTQSTPSGVPTTNIVFYVSDPEAASQTLTVTRSSSDQSLVKDANIVLNKRSGVGTPADPQKWDVQITPVAGLEGAHTVTITLVASDGSLTTPTSFTLNIRPSRERVFVNAKAITIRDNTTADPYPSPVSVSGFAGNVSKVRVALEGFAHHYPSDVSMLLVSPAGQKALFMSKAGDGGSVTNLQLIFDDGMASLLPNSGTMVSGAYKPSVYPGLVNGLFVSPAPSGPYSTNLSALNGASPNGNWNLYIIDDTPPDSGAVSNGWSLGITTQPVIQGLTDVVTPENTPISQRFTVAEESFAATDFTFGASSTNTALVTADGVSFRGSGTSWTVLVNPVLNASGTTLITVAMTNDDAQVVFSTFRLDVTPVNQPPTITQVPDQTIEAGRTVSVAFDYSDPETPRKNLKLNVQSTNASLIPTNNIFIVGNAISIEPIVGQTGSSQITVTVTDDDPIRPLSSNTSFLVTVLPSRNPLFANPNLITIVDNAPASPYPSTITVSRVAGKVSKVMVTLAQVSHYYPDDIGMLLVGPQGQTVELWRNAGGGAPLSNTRITFDDAAASSLPDNDVITNGTYKPSAYANEVTYAAPAPGRPYSTALSAFQGTDPNGTWSLYVIDDTAPDLGAITGGWELAIVTTAPSITSVADQVFPENTTQTVTFTVNSPVTDPTNLVVSASVDNTNLVAALTPGGTGAPRSLAITPVTYANSSVNGTAKVTLAVTDGTFITQTSFMVTVTPVNQAPTITGLADSSVPANVKLTIDFNVTDPEAPPEVLTVGATSSNAGLGTIAVGGGTDGAYSLVFTPGGAPGNTTVSVTAFDGELTTTNTFVVTVTTPRFPIIPPIADQTGIEDIPTIVPFTIGNTSSTNLTVVGTADNTNLVAGVAISGTGFTRAAVIVPVPNANSDLFGPATVTLVATDEFGSGTNSFKLTVTPVDDPPVLGPIADQETTQNVPVHIVLNVSDVDDALTNLTFEGTSSNPSLVSGVSFANNGSKVTATVNLGADQTGLATVTISASDRHSTVSQSFALLVTGAPPTISAIEDQTTNEDTLFGVAFSVGNTLSTNFTLVASASNTNLVESVAIIGSGFDRTAQITLVTNANSELFGPSTITLVAGNEFGLTTNSFKLTVKAVNDAPTISGLADQTTKANAKLTVDFTVDDVDNPVTNLTASVSVSDASLGSAAVSGSGSDRTLTFTPSCVAGDVTVSVMVSDGELVTTNSIAVTITPAVAPIISTIADQTAISGLRAVQVAFTVTDGISDLTVGGAAANADLVAEIDIVGTGGNYTAVLSLVPGAVGNSAIYITASDACNSSTTSFQLIVKPVPLPPTVSAIADQTVNANSKVEVPFTINHVAGSTLTLGGGASNSDLVSAIDFVGTDTSRTAVLTLVKDATGKSSVTISVSDEYGSGTASFELTVKAVFSPTIYPAIADQTVSVNSKVEVPFTINHVAGSTLTLGGSASNSDLVSTIDIVGTDTNRTAVLTLVKDASGKSSVFISVSDEYGSSTATFALTVTPAAVLPAEFGQTLNGFQDDFTGSTRDPNWVAVGPGGDHYVQQDGVLKVFVKDGDPNHLLYMGPGASNTVHEVLARLRIVNFSSLDPARGGIAVNVITNVAGHTPVTDWIGMNLEIRNNSGEDTSAPAKHFKFLDDLRGWGPTAPTNTWATFTWYWMRLKMELKADGTNTVFGKVWNADGVTPEPADWLMTWADSALKTPEHGGYAGITGCSAGGVGQTEVDYILIKSAGLPSIKVDFAAEAPGPTVPFFTSVTKPSTAVIVDWFGGGTLQAADAVVGPWTSLTNTVPPLTVPAANAPQKFYRLQQ